MNRFSLAVLAVLAGSPAVAADIAEPAPEPVAEEVVAIYDWTGGYVGVHKGGSWVRGEFSVPGFEEKEHFNGFLLGGFAGYNYMWDNILIGAEGDVSYNWNDKNFNLGGGVRGDAGTDWQGSLRARVGYAFDRTLIYKTAGWAMTNAHVDTRGNNQERTFNGWTVGAGVEWAATDNIFIRGEYRYNDYDSKNIRGVKVNLSQHQALFGVAYKF